MRPKGDWAYWSGIVPGTDAEPRTVLTRQDWWLEGPESWGDDGRWLLRLERPTRLTVTLLFREDVSVERVECLLGDDLVRREREHTGRRVELGAVRFPAGEVDLGFRCFGESAEPFVPYQVLLTMR